MDWPEDDRLSRAEVDAHNRECQSCHLLYWSGRALHESARRLGVLATDPLGSWRREFWRCRQRRWQAFARAQRLAAAGPGLMRRLAAHAAA